MTRLWLVRLGRNGEREAAALDKGRLTIGFGIAHDIAHLTGRPAVLAEMQALHPDATPGRQGNYAR